MKFLIEFIFQCHSGVRLIKLPQQDSNMYPQNIQDKLADIEQQKQVKQNQLDQLKHRQQALENRVSQKRKSNETRLKILLGSYLIRQLKKTSKDSEVLEKNKQILIEYCQLNKNLKTGQTDSQLIKDFFEQLN